MLINSHPQRLSTAAMSTRSFNFTFLSVLILSAWCTGDLEASPEVISNTPYDGQMERIIPVLQSSTPSPKLPLRTDEAFLEEIQPLIRDIFRIQYRKTPAWLKPEEVRVRKTADCKAKALLLFSELRSRGVPSSELTLAIGSRRSISTRTHVWIIWKRDSTEEMILDPTFYDRAWKSSEFHTGDYQAQYLYCQDQKFKVLSALSKRIYPLYP